MPYVGEQLAGKNSMYVVDQALSGDGHNASLFKVSENVGNTSYLAKYFNRKACVVAGSTVDAERAFKRFKKEAKFLQLFISENIVRYVDEYVRFQDPDVCSESAFVVMELLSGQSVKDFIRYETYNASKVLEIAKDAACGLAHIHSKDVVHRDIHPGNIFVANGTTKIIDFGCAVGAGVTTPFEYDIYQRLAGVKHRAPEATDPTHATAQSDVFSFGLTLLQLANEELIPDDSSSSYRRSIWIDRQIASVGSEYPGQFAGLLRQMVAEDPSTRPNSATVLARIESMSGRTATTYTDDYTDKYDSHQTSSSYGYTSPSRPSYGSSDKGQDSSEGLSMLAKVGIGAGIGAVVLGALAWLTSDDSENGVAGTDGADEPANEEAPKLVDNDGEQDGSEPDIA